EAQMARLVGAPAHLGQQRLPLVPRLAVILPVSAGVLAAMVEEADVVVLALQRADLALDGFVEFAQVRRNVGRDLEIHGPSSGDPDCKRAFTCILGGRQVDAEAAAATLCRQANRVTTATTRDLAHQRQSQSTAAAGLARVRQAIEGLEDPL